MFTTVSVQLPHPVLLQLIAHLEKHGGPQDLSAVMQAAVELWLSEQQSPRPGQPSLHGYQWKSLFLPEGTRLRSWSYGEHNYAEVVGDQIIHNGRAVSPNQFARSFARSNRNAWSDLSVRRPGDKKWTIASRLRRELAIEQARGALAAATADRVYAVDGPPPAAAAEPPKPRQVEAGPEWSLPERRKHRFRMEDVAY
ncbi:hypothetical protein [Rugamonas sp. DEMB1]|jgi:hypothetical protein|uniref:hypothetical protein n=1 Tax=Rugamonas sp. DEMB1 TaxID=3039386 RepID=UPI002449567E|nr:hypothetical protein [Rugamonas sp. DEMB1]WGG50207.1 hypothetical protein QC826_27855 [Rugamonas sp. DEMB1]